ncbi:uncharacterized protein V1510DRAFT_418443 [Dipodascopsis tothii]|uniref:uncharacterized protein n=1 Tax=Dipodascopsis tothii TaxID=44089 RepID=UPI0034CF763C
MTKRTIQPGVHCPLVTPFKADSGDIDYDAFKRQILRLTRARVGLVLQGTNGEACHMTFDERVEAVRFAREVLDSNGFSDTPLLVGTGCGSARETIALTNAAAAVGADAAIVIHPGYFAFAMGKDRAAIKAFFLEVFEGSSIPVMIYNFPGAASGIDLDSDLLSDLADHPNCFGAKLTCAGIAKGERLATYTKSKAYRARKSGEFLVLPGFSDCLFSAMVAGAHGCITGTGNVFPKLIVAFYDAIVDFLTAPTPEKFARVTELQAVVSHADWTIVKVGISGTKYALDKIEAGLGGAVRSPLAPASEGVRALVDQDLAKAFELELAL